MIIWSQEVMILSFQIFSPCPGLRL